MKKRRVSLVLVMTMIFVMMMSMTSMAFTNVIGTVGSKGANIRESASTSGKIVGSVAPNARFTICGEVSGSDGYTWYLVFVDKDQTGYVRADVVTNTGTAAGGETPNSLATGGSTGGGTTGGTTGGGTTTTPAPTPTPEVTAEPADCTLGLLTIQEGTLEPEFSAGVYEYVLTVAEITENVTVYAVPTDANAQIEEELGFYNLELGSNDRYITVKGSDGTTAVYHFNIVRGEVTATPEPTPTDTVEPTDDGTTDNSDETTTPVTKSTGVSRWVVILLILVIVALLAAVVFMALQMRDLKEQVAILEREKRRRRKRTRDMHTISTNTEDGTGSRRETRAVPPVQKSEYRIQPDIPAPRVRTKVERDEELTTEPAEPVYEEPVYEEPIASEPVYEEPAYEEPVYEAPAYEEEPAVEPDQSEESRFEEASFTARSRKGSDEPSQEEKDGWKSVNFLAPEEDMEFEFLNLDEDDKG